MLELKREMLLINIKKRINRNSAGEISNFSTDAQHLSKLGSQSAYVLVGADGCPRLIWSAVGPHFYIRNC